MEENKDLKEIKNLKVRPAGRKLILKIAAGLVIVTLVAIAAYQKYTGYYDNNAFAKKIAVAYDNDRLDLEKAMQLELVKVYGYNKYTGECIGEVNYEDTLFNTENYRYELEAPYESGWAAADVVWEGDKKYLRFDKNSRKIMKSIGDTNMEMPYKKNIYSIIRDECLDKEEMHGLTNIAMPYPNGTLVVVKENGLTIQDKDNNVELINLVKGGKIHCHSSGYISLTNKNGVGYLYVLPDGTVIKKFVNKDNENGEVQYVTSEGLIINFENLTDTFISSYTNADGKYRIPIRCYGSNECVTVEGVDFNGNKCMKAYSPQRVNWIARNGDVIHECGIVEDGPVNTYRNKINGGMVKINESTGSVVQQDDGANLLSVHYGNGYKVEITTEGETECARVYTPFGELVKEIECDNYFDQFYCGDVIFYDKDGVSHMLYFGKYDYTFSENYELMGEEDITSSFGK